MDVWTPVLNEELILKREPTNDRDSNAVAVKKEVIVGHVPFNLAPFLFRRFSGATQIVDLPRSLAIKNRGTGYGLEIPCEYSLYDPKPYIDKLRELVASLEAKGLVSASNKD